MNIFQSYYSLHTHTDISFLDGIIKSTQQKEYVDAQYSSIERAMYDNTLIYYLGYSVTKKYTTDTKHEIPSEHSSDITYQIIQQCNTGDIMHQRCTVDYNNNLQSYDSSPKRKTIFNSSKKEEIDIIKEKYSLESLRIQ